MTLSNRLIFLRRTRDALPSTFTISHVCSSVCAAVS